MDCNVLLQRQLANRLVCQTQQIAVGPTGATGSSGPLGPTGFTGANPPTIGLTKSFTILVDFTAGTGISKIYIPPGFFSVSAAQNLSQGGTFTADVSPDLLFQGGQQDSITCSNTQYSFISGINASGFYSSGLWSPIAGGNIGGTTTKLSYQFNTNNSVIITNITTSLLTSGNTATRPQAGAPGDGFLATITLFYI